MSDAIADSLGVPNNMKHLKFTETIVGYEWQCILCDVKGRHLGNGTAICWCCNTTKGIRSIKRDVNRVYENGRGWSYVKTSEDVKGYFGQEAYI